MGLPRDRPCIGLCQRGGPEKRKEEGPLPVSTRSWFERSDRECVSRLRRTPERLPPRCRTCPATTAHPGSGRESQPPSCGSRRRSAGRRGLADESQKKTFKLPRISLKMMNETRVRVSFPCVFRGPVSTIPTGQKRSRVWGTKNEGNAPSRCHVGGGGGLRFTVKSRLGGSAYLPHGLWRTPR